MNVNAVNYPETRFAMSDFVSIVTRPYIEGMLKGAVLSGHSPEVILEKAGLPRDLLADPNASIGGAAFQNLWVALIEITGDQFMGFLEQPAKPAMVQQQYKSRSQAKTFGDFIRIGTQFHEDVRNDVHYECLRNREHHEFTLTLQFQLRDGVDEHVFYWYRLTLIYHYYCWIIGKRIKFHRVSFASPKPDFYLDCQPLFNCEVLFDQEHNAISFDDRYLLHPVIRSEDEYAELTIADWLSPPYEDRSWSRRVTEILIRLQKENIWYPTIDQVADVLSVSPRTLRRQLQQENDGFHNIKQRVRCDVAKKLLVTTDTPITLVANEVGYTEPGVFTRAFVSWTSMTPSDYRTKHRMK